MARVRPFQPIALHCGDGYRLHGHAWRHAGPHAGTVIINPATGVLARYYHRYAHFLAGQGFSVVTYDYRGIGLSRPDRMRGAGIRWRDWGELDFDAVIAWAQAHCPDGPLMVVGHSIGGFLPGFAPEAHRIDRMLTVGAQYAYWRDYLRETRLSMLLKWHVAMPALTALCGYFPGRRLGWLEDLPAGVANEWSFRGAKMEASYPAHDRPLVKERFAAVRAPILAIGTTDDEYGTPQAIARGLGYYRGSERFQILLSPAEFGMAAVGHFDLFHSRHAEGFWPMTCEWLLRGVNPWPVHRHLPAQCVAP